MPSTVESLHSSIILYLMESFSLLASEGEAVLRASAGPFMEQSQEGEVIRSF